MLGACENPMEAVVAKPVFKVGSESCSKNDAKVILMNYQKEYSNLYGIDMWEHDYGQEQSLEDYIKGPVHWRRWHRFIQWISSLLKKK